MPVVIAQAKLQQPPTRAARPVCWLGPGRAWLKLAVDPSPASVMGRNTLDAFREQIGCCRMADIAETEDADHPFTLVDYR